MYWILYQYRKFNFVHQVLKFHIFDLQINKLQFFIMQEISIANHLITSCVAHRNFSALNTVFAQNFIQPLFV